MTKGKKQEITIADVLAKKKLIKDYSVYHSNYFDRDFNIDKISPDKVVSIMNNTNSTEFEKYTELIYNSCSFFRAKELQRELEIDNPYDVIEAVFNDNYAEIFELGNTILKKYGFIGDKVEEIKKP